MFNSSKRTDLRLNFTMKGSCCGEKEKKRGKTLFKSCHNLLVVFPVKVNKKEKLFVYRCHKSVEKWKSKKFKKKMVFFSEFSKKSYYRSRK